MASAVVVVEVTAGRVGEWPVASEDGQRRSTIRSHTTRRTSVLLLLEEPVARLLGLGHNKFGFLLVTRRGGTGVGGRRRVRSWMYPDPFESRVRIRGGIRARHVPWPGLRHHRRHAYVYGARVSRQSIVENEMKHQQGMSFTYPSPGRTRSSLSARRRTRQSPRRCCTSMEST